MPLSPVGRLFTPLSSAGLSSGKIAWVLNPDVPVYKFTIYVFFYFHECDVFCGFIGIWVFIYNIIPEMYL